MVDVNMLRIHQVNVTDPKNIEEKLLKKLNMPKKDLLSWSVHRKSVDARKGKVLFSFVIDAEVRHEKKYLSKKDVTIAPDESFHFEPKGTQPLHDRPVVAGFGPAGIFAALLLAEYGYRPIVLERGAEIEQRQKDVKTFWNGGPLDPESNVQFGMGGAGAFSDGKLTTRSKDIRIRRIFDDLVRFGANPEILYEQHPHIGTDGFVPILKNARAYIESKGGTFRFDTRLEDLQIEDNALEGIDYCTRERDKDSKAAGAEEESCHSLGCQALIAAIGHSAGDTIQMFSRHGMDIENKPFAIGVRIEHLQEYINKAMLKDQAHNPDLIPARYQLTFKSSQDKGVYTFCMCPGGYVIAAQSAPQTVVVNGMSYSDRAGENANAALLVQIDESDTGSEPFAGIHYQEELEKKAWDLSASNKAPVQLASDFVAGRMSDHFEQVKPTYPLGTVFADFNTLLPAPAAAALKEALIDFERRVPGFLEGALLTGVETRSSSAVRLNRDRETMLSSIAGVYPAGEGSGYSGGIMTSALDGLKAAMALMDRFDRPADASIK